jgi:tetratricopeptide (TPR) repeat protein
MLRRAALLLHLCTAADPYYERGLAAARKADLARAKASFSAAGETASALQALATLHLIDGDVAKAVAARRKAKAIDAQALPPLAVLFRDGHDCGGLGDVYWSGAFLLKKLDETNVSDEVAFEGHLQLSTVLEDSGALVEASEHVRRASLIKPDDARLRFRSALLVPAVSASMEAVNSTRSELERRVALLPETLETLDGVSMPGTFYIVYLGFDDASLMTSIQRAYRRAHPPLKKQLVATTKKERLRIGFASAYWKRHSVCKLLCGVVRGLAALPDFEVVLFDATEESDDWLAWTLETGASHRPMDMTLSSRTQVQDVVVLVYAELGMRARALTWAHARLAPVQVLFWGHPHTSGLPVSDSEQNINLNLIWWRRWRLHEPTSPRRRRRGRQRVYSTATASFHAGLDRLLHIVGRLRAAE